MFHSHTNHISFVSSWLAIITRIFLSLSLFINLFFTCMYLKYFGQEGSYWSLHKHNATFLYNFVCSAISPLQSLPGRTCQVFTLILRFLWKITLIISFLAQHLCCHSIWVMCVSNMLPMPKYIFKSLLFREWKHEILLQVKQFQSLFLRTRRIICSIMPVFSFLPDIVQNLIMFS